MHDLDADKIYANAFLPLLLFLSLTISFAEHLIKESSLLLIIHLDYKTNTNNKNNRIIFFLFYDERARGDLVCCWCNK